MFKLVSHLVLLVLLLNVGMLFAQDAAPAGEGEGSASEATAAVDLGAMTYDELVSYLSSLSPEAFANVIVDVLYSGDRYLARRVVAAANQVIADAGEKAQELVDAVMARGGNTVVVQNNTIKMVAPQTNSLLKKFDVPSAVQEGVELPPDTPTYSAGAAM